MFKYNKIRAKELLKICDKVPNSPALFAAIVLLVLGLFSAHSARSAPIETLNIITSKQRIALKVELSRSDRELQRGLMFRHSVPRGTGMLFDFGREQPIAMWMKDTYVSLDMLFIDAAGRVIAIETHTTPQSLTPISPPSPARAVLEIPGGDCDYYGIGVGDRVEYPIFHTGSGS